MKRVDVANYCGVSIDNVRQLANVDPLFQELVEYYRSRRTDEFDHIHDGMVEVLGEGIDELRRRLREEPEKLSTSQIVSIVKDVGDRAGYGPTRTEKNININAELWETLDRGDERARGVMLEGSAEEVA